LYRNCFAASLRLRALYSASLASITIPLLQMTSKINSILSHGPNTISCYVACLTLCGRGER
jgi:hypothetical protein